MKSSGFGGFGKCTLAMLLVVFAPAAVPAALFQLQGQSNGSATWTSALRHWRDLDYIPVRVFITGSAVCDKSVTISFPHLNSLGPGFEGLTGFTTSTNVVLRRGPTLTQLSCRDWSTTLRVDYTGCGPGHIEFLARLAEGACLNKGDTLKLKVNAGSLGELQVQRPALSESISPGVRQGIERAQTLPSAGFQVEFATEFNRFYGIQYSRELQNWKTAQSLILGKGSLVQWVDNGPPVTESAPETQPMRFYRLFRLPYQLNDCEADKDEEEDDEDDDGNDD